MNPTEKRIVEEFNRLNEPFHIRENKTGHRWELISPCGCRVSWDLGELVNTAEFAARAFRVGKRYSKTESPAPLSVGGQGAEG